MPMSRDAHVYGERRRSHFENPDINKIKQRYLEILSSMRRDESLDDLRVNGRAPQIKHERVQSQIVLPHFRIPTIETSQVDLPINHQSAERTPDYVKGVNCDFGMLADEVDDDYNLLPKLLERRGYFQNDNLVHLNLDT
jgi:hypothetical protein